ncbi:uracil-DNA glycosylase [Onchocerca flexuosa]|uniref:Uracil-DNA glycosylase n=2 Tax=Onchocerca flexuosa TaxID=387005 RepID=A0A238BTM5_9BILA|nr:uracil-DNA glycosylase [Onchocerca flexuosa]
MNKTSSIAKRASLGTSTKCNNLMSWLKQKEPSLENKTTTKISFVEKKNTLESGKEDIVPAPQSSAEYLRSLVEDTGWRKVLLVEFRKEYMNKIVKFLQKEKEKGVKVFPPQHLIFNAFNLTPLQQIRVVLIGQDPYHDDNQAHGLCFSVCKGVRLPPSLINIYKELKTDIPNFKIPDHGCLESWARQGVFMLNATLTVEAHRPNSHNHIGWQKFTDEVIRIISRDCKGIVFLLWGGFAHKKEYIIDKKKHIIIKTAHPSPLSARMFFGCKCFSRTNEALVKLGQPAIDWSSF